MKVSNGSLTTLLGCNTKFVIILVEPPFDELEIGKSFNMPCFS
jgi:hypothetical protein